MSTLVLVRHGESQWNLTNRFTGWVDVPLTQRGVEEAVLAAEQLRDIHVHHAFTSRLQRAQSMLSIILSRQDKNAIFMHYGEEQEHRYTSEHYLAEKDIFAHVEEVLNERYYGALQGLNKDQARQQYGDEQVRVWRRSYDVRPPGGESIDDVYQRVTPFFMDRVIPLLEQGSSVLIASHGNTIRALLRHTEELPIKQVPLVDLPPGESIVYEWNQGALLRISKPITFERPYQSS